MLEIPPIVIQPQTQTAFKAKPNQRMIKQIAKASDAINNLNPKLSFAQRIKIWFASKLCKILSPDTFLPKSNKSMQNTYRRSGSLVDDMAEMMANNLLLKPIDKWTKADSEFIKNHIEKKYGSINLKIPKKK